MSVLVVSIINQCLTPVTFSNIQDNPIGQQSPLVFKPPFLRGLFHKFGFLKLKEYFVENTPISPVLLAGDSLTESLILLRPIVF